jgi:hypothetical protein
MSRRKRRRKTSEAKTQSVEPKQGREQVDDSDFSKVGELLDRYNIPELDPLPEEFEEYLDIPFHKLSNLSTEEIHTSMSALTYQLAFIDTLVANAEIEVRQLEREFTQTWHDNYEGQNKKMNAERMQLENGTWEQLDIAKGVLRRVEVEKNRLESNYRLFSRLLSSKQSGV